MTRTGLKELLMALMVPRGILAPAKGTIAGAAVDIGFAWFWGDHPWTFRRKETTLTTVSSQAYVECPKDFEQGISLTCREAGNEVKIKVVSENRFDGERPYPTDNPEGRPSEAKLVFNADWGEKPQRLYLWRVPDGVYTLALAYLKSANPGVMAGLPPWTTNAIVECAKYHAGLTGFQEAQIALDNAIARDGGFIVFDGGYKFDPTWSDWFGADQFVDGAGRWYVDIP